MKIIHSKFIQEINTAGIFVSFSLASLQVFLCCWRCIYLSSYVRVCASLFSVSSKYLPQYANIVKTNLTRCSLEFPRLCKEITCFRPCACEYVFWVHAHFLFTPKWFHQKYIWVSNSPFVLCVYIHVYHKIKLFFLNFVNLFQYINYRII